MSWPNVCFVYLMAVIFGAASQKIKIRLVGGKHSNEGRIQLFRDKKWRDVCDNKWDLNGARVACRMLGYPGAERFTFGDWWGRGTGSFWLDEVVCHGDEDSLATCAHKDWGVHKCSNDRVAGVVCRDYEEAHIIKPTPSIASKKIVDLDVQLIGLAKDFKVTRGLFLVKFNGLWGLVCSDNWTQENSKVACGMLGYPNAVIDQTSDLKGKKFQSSAQNLSLSFSGKKSYDFLMANVSCSGLESSLVECPHLGWGPLVCFSDFAVHLNCVETPLHKNNDIRLKGSHQLHEGRLEIKSSDPKQDLHWGTVCDDHFDLKDANVACRSLGLGTASRVFTNAKFGQGIGPIYMDDVHCKGWEKSLAKCSHKQDGDCSHYEDVSIRCHTPRLHKTEVRLVGGTTNLEGYVEIFDEHGWGGVCAEDWGLEEAIVACRELNLGFAQQATNGNYFRLSDSKIRHSKVECKINDPSLSHCDRQSSSKEISCENNLRAGIICISAVPDLVVDISELEKSVSIATSWLLHLKCAYEEKCLSESAQDYWDTRSNGHARRLLRFTTRIENRGLAPFRPDVPQSAWQWHSCHNHYHSMETFSTYQLLTTDSREVGEGHKASFCLEDTHCDKGLHKTFNCTNRGPQGISPNCYDVYRSNIDCQWIDVTDFPHGNFILRITVNPERRVAESDYTNNIAKCWIYDYGSLAIPARCHLETCESGYRTSGGNANGACCNFPFKYQGKWHYKCLETHWKTLWCSTTSDFDKDKQWGNCF